MPDIEYNALTDHPSREENCPMAELHLENVPEELYRGLEQLAEADQLPVAEETLRLLREAIRRKQASEPPPVIRSQREILDEIIRNRVTAPPGSPTSAEMIREDRDR
jgi:hypothetical protein